MTTKQDILDVLEDVKDPVDGRSIISKNMVVDVQSGSDGHVQIVIEVDPARGAELEPLRQEAERVVIQKGGASKVTAILTAQKKAEAAPANDPHGMNKNPRLDDLPIKKIIAVASGKGGVGKSTVAVNLAVELAKQGQKAGILDADIYGPSVPLLTGLPHEKPEQEDGQLIPFEKHGLKIMSIGFMVDPGQALVWRGPMVQTALYQMFRDVKWAEENDPLDVLIVDMPPGTGDAQLTLAQKVPVTGAVIVSTPQDLALIDARKAIEMFEKVDVQILGLVENMSTYICPSCGHEEHIFGHGGAEEEAEKIGVPFLGALPLHMGIRRKADAGEPVEEVFEGIAKTLISKH